MKRFLLSIALLTCFLLGFAQKNTPMRAYNLYYEQENAKAKECIDECIKDEKFAAKASTWLYKANIEYRLATEEYSARQKDPKYKYQFPTAAKESFLAFKKAAELNKNVEATEMFSPGEALPILYPVLFIEGVDEMTAKNYEGARDILALAVESYEMQTPQYPLKGELYYYYAYVFTMLDDTQNAQKYYQKAIDDGSENVNVYIGMIDGYKKDGKKKELFDLINKGLQKDPNNAALRVAEADYYYWVGDVQTAREKLSKLPSTVAKSPESAISAANLYIKDSMYIEAESLLKRAYSFAPDNYTIAHNLGVCCSNIGEYKFLEAESIKLHGDKNVYAALIAESKDYLTRSAEYFEAALKGNPGELTVLKRLRQIYLRLEKPDKASEIEGRINQIENK